MGLGAGAQCPGSFSWEALNLFLLIQPWGLARGCSQTSGMSSKADCGASTRRGRVELPLRT